MLTILGDTHGETDHRLSGRTLDAVREADHVCHTGDFTTEAVFDAIAAEAGRDTADGSAPLTAVQGNSDSADLCSRLPETATVEYDGYRIVLAHGHRHNPTTLGLLAREAEADLVAVGHTHVAGFESMPHALIVNPGSHTEPRGAPATDEGRKQRDPPESRPTHVEIGVGGRGQVTIRTSAGTLLAERTL